MAIQWADFTFPPINLWNMPRQPGLERQWLRRFAMRSDMLVKRSGLTGLSYKAAMECATSKYPVAVRRDDWCPGVCVTVDENGQLRLGSHGMDEPWGPTSEDMAARDWSLAYGYINKGRA
jgi:hypothetical protein